jgi:hypothetical protein
MFCTAVSDASRLNAWNTNPTRWRRSTVSLGSRNPVSSTSPRWTVPEVGRSRPAAQCMKVLLPEPEGPMTAVKLPLGRAKVTSRSAWTALAPLP